MLLVREADRVRIAQRFRVCVRTESGSDRINQVSRELLDPIAIAPGSDTSFDTASLSLGLGSET